MQNSETLSFTIRYDLTEELARQAGVDLWDSRMARLKAGHPEWGSSRPLLLLGLAALQVVLALAWLVWISDGIDNIDVILLVAGAIILGIILFKASFYALPFLGRWLVIRQSLRLLRGMAHTAIVWRLYEDRLETESASTQRRIRWSDVRQMNLVGQSILLTLHDRLELMMPASALNAEALHFLASRISITGPHARNNEE